MEISFRRAKMLANYESQFDINDYTNKEYRDAMNFLQNEVPSSPLVHRIRTVKRNDLACSSAKITELIQ